MAIAQGKTRCGGKAPPNNFGVVGESGESQGKTRCRDKRHPIIFVSLVSLAIAQVKTRCGGKASPQVKFLATGFSYNKRQRSFLTQLSKHPDDMSFALSAWPSSLSKL